MTAVIVIIVVLVVAALAAAAWVMFQKQRSAQLQQRFGPEYDRAVEGADSRREAESHLAGIAQQRDKLDLRDLDEAERTRFTTEWEGVQARFVDEPGQAVDAADSLITTVMRERGYPVEDFDQRADLVAADHPEVVSHYREAHAAHERHRSAGGVDTEDLRQSFVHYRALFAALVDDDVDTEGALWVDTARTDADQADLDRTSTDRTSTDRASTDRTGSTRLDADRPDSDVAARERVVDSDQNGTYPTYPQETR
jgi:type II secretory pathway pseudopilin PulG